MVRSVNCIAHNNAGCLAVHRTSRRSRQAIISQHHSTAFGTVPIATSQERLLSIAGLSSADACRSVRLLSRGCLQNGAPNVIPAARHAHSRTIASHRTFSTAVRPVTFLILQAPTRQRCRSHATSARRRNISPRAEGRNWLVSFQSAVQGQEAQNRLAGEITGPAEECFSLVYSAFGSLHRLRAVPSVPDARLLRA